MTAETFFQLFNQYGLILVCAVVFCEYMKPARISGRRYHSVRRCADCPERAVAAADGFS